jgi:hypothetical protein
MKDRQEVYGWRRELMIARARLAGATEAEAEAKVTLPKLTRCYSLVGFCRCRTCEERRAASRSS